METKTTIAADTLALRVFLGPLLGGILRTEALSNACRIAVEQLEMFVLDSGVLTPEELCRLDRFLRRNLSFGNPLAGVPFNATQTVNHPHKNQMGPDFLKLVEEHTERHLMDQVSRYLREAGLVDTQLVEYPMGSRLNAYPHLEITAKFNTVPNFGLQQVVI